MKELFNNYLPIDYVEMRNAKFLENMNESNLSDIDRVNSREGFQEVKSCEYCKSPDNIPYLNKNGIEIIECKNCGLIYSSKHPINFDNLYSEEEYLDYTIEAYEKNSKFRKERFGNERLDILKKYKETGKLLDLGCGIGWFLELAIKHYDVLGVELSDSLRKYLKEEKGIKSFKTLDKIKDDSLDIITAFDLIEHVPNPGNMLRDIYSKLKFGGISLLYTPNVNSVGFSVLKEANNLLDPPGHLYYFNKKTIANFAEKAGFRIVKIWTKGIDVGDLYSLELANGNNEIAKYLENNQIWIQGSIDDAGYGNHMRVLLRKE